ncbi:MULTISPECIES: hypothetical protein [unclassified Microbulbifer]|uniref:hypothetical protein n=1 Tax=unclassified Microbulbifer TaxID=2619833 RepID=UPI0027E44DEF|nr:MULTISPECIES: hypothetical protein [unclassified Microbulbifer]
MNDYTKRLLKRRFTIYFFLFFVLFGLLALLARKMDFIQSLYMVLGGAFIMAVIVIVVSALLDPMLGAHHSSKQDEDNQ